jgi:stage V sporulation protein M
MCAFFVLLKTMLKVEAVADSLGGDKMKFYTIKLPKFLGGIVRAMLGSFSKD